MTSTKSSQAVTPDNSMFVKKIDTRFIAASFLILALFTFVNGQSPDKPTKEEKKQAEQEKKNREKQAKADAKRQKQEAEIQASLETLIPIGKDVSYDRFKDISRVTTKLMKVLGDKEALSWGQAYVQMFATYEVQGETLTVPTSIKLAFVTLGFRPFFPSAQDRTLTLIVNGSKRVALGEMAYAGNLSERCCKELALTTFSLEDFRALTEATSVEARIGRVEFAFHPRHFEGLRVLIKDLPKSAVSFAVPQLNGGTDIATLHPLVGSWKFGMTEDGRPQEWVLVIEKQGDSFSGALRIPRGTEIFPRIAVAGNMFSVTARGEDGTVLTIDGKASGNTMSGKVTVRRPDGTIDDVAYDAIRR